MKTFSVALFCVMLVSARSFASEEVKDTTYVAAFAQNEHKAIPGSLTFTKEGGKTYLTLQKGDLHVRMSVRVLRIDDPFKTEKNQYFDAAYTADNGLLSVLVTGRIVGEYSGIEGVGDGKIAIHEAASDKNDYMGSIAIYPFVIAPLSAEQAGAGQPATHSESKSEDGDKPQPESERRSR